MNYPPCVSNAPQPSWDDLVRVELNEAIARLRLAANMVDGNGSHVLLPEEIRQVHEAIQTIHLLGMTMRGDRP